MLDIKKLISVLLLVLMLCCVFAGCSGKGEEDSTTLPGGAITTQGAKIKEADAINYIKNSYTVEELGLQDVADDYNFMVASTGLQYEGKNYIKVVANIVTQNEDVTSKDGEKTFSMKAVGEYLISFDGDEILKKDMDSDKYSKLENRIDSFKSESN